jgi:DNA primase
MSTRHDLQKKAETASQFFQDSLFDDQVIDGMTKAPLNKQAKEYLASRGLWEPDPAFKVGFYPAASFVTYLDQKDLFRKNSTDANAISTDFSYLKDRIIFPWCDENGEVVGLTGRSIGAPREGKPKYWNSRNTEIFKKSELLWGHHLAKDAIRESGELLIVEGYTDVMSLHKAGIKQTVSPIGIAISRPQLDKIFKLNDHVLVCLDGDKAGQKASADVAKRTLTYLNETGLANQGKSMSFALLRGGKDPDEILREGGVDAFREAIRERMSLKEMIAYGEASKRREIEIQERSGGTAAANGRVTQNAEGSRLAAMKRSAPDAEEHRQKRRRSTGGLDL